MARYKQYSYEQAEEVPSPPAPSFDAFYDIVSCVEMHTSCMQSRF